MELSKIALYLYCTVRLPERGSNFNSVVMYLHHGMGSPRLSTRAGSLYGARMDKLDGHQLSKSRLWGPLALRVW